MLLMMLWDWISLNHFPCCRKSSILLERATLLYRCQKAPSAAGSNLKLNTFGTALAKGQPEIHLNETATHFSGSRLVSAHFDGRSLSIRSVS